MKFLPNVDVAIATGWCRSLVRTAAILIGAGLLGPWAWAQNAGSSSSSDARNLTDWLSRVHDATRQRSFTGTLVVSAGGQLGTSRIWHACDGVQQFEKVEVLNGAPRTIVRRNTEVITFATDIRVARKETRESLGVMPELLRTHEGRIADHYRLSMVGVDRVAGYAADVLDIEPKDALRFGYRVWAEKKTGLLLKLQTLDHKRQVREQVAFTELQLDAPVSMDRLKAQMNSTDGYSVESAKQQKTSAQAQGWRLKQAIPGFVELSCHTPSAQAKDSKPMQWVFSDGLASVSLFLEAFDSKRHVAEMSSSSGATHVLTRQMGAHWLTAMGEVPVSTLEAFANSIERLK
jgi:sigma-E factor negative regulatory protein RseB